MDGSSTSTRLHTKTEGNKENTRPSHGNRVGIQNHQNVPPFLKKRSVNQKDPGKRAENVPKSDGKEAASTSNRPLVHWGKAAPLPKTSAVKVAAGTYKGRIVQSKVGSLWKSSSTAGAPSRPKPVNPGAARAPPSSSKCAPQMCERVTHKPTTTTQSAASSSRPPPGLRPAPPPPRSVSAHGSTRLPVAPIKGSGRTKMLAPEKKVNKSSASSTVSQYRVNVESTEDRRAKLAAWMASKGKSRKRPAMTEAAPPKTREAAKPEGDPGQKTDGGPAAAECRADTQEAKDAKLTVQIADTSLDLLEISDTELQETVDDVVVNLCAALEAMATPSTCSEAEPTQTVTGSSGNGRGQSVSEGTEKKWEELEGIGPEPMLDEREESGNQEVKTEDDDDEDEEGQTPAAPVQLEEASIIKYNVRTTPYLQSVRRTLDEDVSSGSRRKSNIKELKFLTPVRRSNRLQQRAWCLPAMLVDHDPCVSSLAELVHLDQEANAYIYRKNTALPEDAGL